ncbi:hypothetical protein LINPERPRIM_LOCUS33414, partial [Linum perenne]
MSSMPSGVSEVFLSFFNKLGRHSVWNYGGFGYLSFRMFL